MFSRLQSTFSSQPKASTEEEADKMDRIQKLERSLQRILVHAIEVYRSNCFEGTIVVGGSLGPFSTSIEHEVSAGEGEEDVTDDEFDDESSGGGEAAVAEKEESKTRMHRLAVASIDRIIKNLIQRSRAWKKFKAKGAGSTMLTSGLSMSDPFFGSVSFSLELSVSVESLKAYCDSNSVAVAAVVTSPNASDPLAHSTATTTTTTAATATASATATAVANYTATNSNVVQGKVL